MEEKLFNFVYITTNSINGKRYVGDHATDDLNDGYLGSGIYFQNALNEYKAENFRREILELFSTKQEAFDAQQKYIDKYDTLKPNGYNLSPKGGLHVKGCHSEETKKAIGQSNSVALKGKHLPPFTEEHKQKIGKANAISLKGKKQSKETIEKRAKSLRGKPSKLKGKPQPKETVEKRAKSNTGKKRTVEQKARMKAAQQNRKELTPEQKKRCGDVHRGKKLSEEHCEKISKALKGRSSDRKGRTFVEIFGEEKANKLLQLMSKKQLGKVISEETRKKQSLAAKGKPKSKEHKLKMSKSRCGIKQSEETKRKRSISMKGKNKGNKSEETKRKISESKKGQAAWNKSIPCSEESKRKQIETKRKNKIKWV